MAKTKLYIEFTDYDIKLIEAQKKKNKLIVTKVKKENLSTSSQEDKEAALKTLLGYKKKSTKECNVLISTSNILTKTVEIPKLKRKDIQSLLENNLPQYFAVEGHEYLISFKILTEFEKEIEEEKKDFLRLLLVAYPKDMFESMIELCNSFNLKPNNMDVYPNVVFDRFSKYKEPISIVDIQDNGANCVIVSENDLFLYALFNPNESEEFFAFEDTNPIQSISNTISGYLNFYSSKHFGEKVKQIFLFASEEKEELQTHLQNYIDGYVQFNSIPFNIEFKKKKRGIIENQEFLSLFSFAMKEKKKHDINLMEKFTSLSKETSHKKTFMITAVAMGLLGMIYTIGEPYYQKIMYNQEIDSIEKRLSESENLSTKYNEYQTLLSMRTEKERLLATLKKSQYDYSTLLSITYFILPAGVTIEQFLVKDKGLVQVTFKVPNTLKASELVSNINDLEYFENVFLESVSLNDRPESIVLNLTILDDKQEIFLLKEEM